jgi:Fe2+ or Zn2+ uptake regulation protein
MPEESSQRPTRIDELRSLTLGYARQFLDDLLNLNLIPRPDGVVILEGGWRIQLIVRPSKPGEGVSGLTQVDHDILEFLATCQKPLTGKKLKKALEKHYGGAYAEITVRRSLKKLVKLKLIANARGTGVCGYYLRNHFPLFHLPVPKDKDEEDVERADQEATARARPVSAAPVPRPRLQFTGA